MGKVSSSCTDKEGMDKESFLCTSEESMGKCEGSTGEECLSCEESMEKGEGSTGEECLSCTGDAGMDKEYISSTSDAGKDKEYISSTSDAGKDKEYISSTSDAGKDEECLSCTGDVDMGEECLSWKIMEGSSCTYKEYSCIWVKEKLLRSMGEQGTGEEHLSCMSEDKECVLINVATAPTNLGRGCASCTCEGDKLSSEDWFSNLQ